MIRRFAVVVVAAGAALGMQPAAGAQEKSPLALLEARNYEQLEKDFGRSQRGYARGAVSELDLLEAFRGFYTTEPALHERFNEWVERYPRSYAARLARGIYYKRIGVERRGDKYVAETPGWRFFEMEHYFRKAMTDLKASVALEAKPILSYFHMMDLQKGSPRLSIDLPWFRFTVFDPKKDTLNAALEIAPSSFIIRRKYMHTLEARWGGATGEMQAFLAECRKANLTREELNLLEALVHSDRGWVRYVSRDFGGAFEEYQRAAALVDLKNDALFERGQRGALLWGIAAGYQGVKRYDESLPFFNQAIEAGENDANVYFSRGISLHHVGRKEDALKDYLRAAEGGIAWAQNEVGMHYWHGIILERNRDEAIKWFTRAAEQNLPDAKKNLEWAKKG